VPSRAFAQLSRLGTPLPCFRKGRPYDDAASFNLMLRTAKLLHPASEAGILDRPRGLPLPGRRASPRGPDLHPAGCRELSLGNVMVCLCSHDAPSWLGRTRARNLPGARPGGRSWAEIGPGARLHPAAAHKRYRWIRHASGPPARLSREPPLSQSEHRHLGHNPDRGLINSR